MKGIKASQWEHRMKHHKYVEAHFTACWYIHAVEYLTLTECDALQPWTEPQWEQHHQYPRVFVRFNWKGAPTNRSSQIKIEELFRVAGSDYLDRPIEWIPPSCWHRYSPSALLTFGGLWLVSRRMMAAFPWQLKVQSEYSISWTQSHCLSVY